MTGTKNNTPSSA